MRRTLALFVLIAVVVSLTPLLATPAVARNIRFAFVTGLSAASLITNENVGDQRPMYDMRLGVQAVLPLRATTSMIVEAAYSAKGFNAEDAHANAVTGENYWAAHTGGVSMYYLDVSALYAARFGALQVYGGPYLGLFHSGKYHYEEQGSQGECVPFMEGRGVAEPNEWDVTVPDFGLTVGVNLLNGPVFLGPRYSRGLHDIASGSNFTGYNSVFSFNVGFMF